MVYASGCPPPSTVTLVVEASADCLNVFKVVTPVAYNESSSLQYSSGKCTNCPGGQCQYNTYKVCPFQGASDSNGTRSCQYLCDCQLDKCPYVQVRLLNETRNEDICEITIT